MSRKILSCCLILIVVRTVRLSTEHKIDRLA